MSAKVDKRMVTIKSDRPKIVVSAWVGADFPIVTQGYGGWTTIPRPRRQSLTAWQGHEPYGLSLPIVLDGFVGDESVESKCTALERMARPPKILDEPPLLRIDGFIPHNDLVWVLQAIAWADVIRNEKGQRVRQNATLSLLRYIADDRVQLLGAAARARQKAGAQTGSKSGSTSGGGGKAAPYVVKQGDTLQGIASKILGDYKRWGEIAKLNGIRDPHSIRAGQRLKMP